MTYIDILLIGIGLSMDAFAVAICKALSMRGFELKKALIIGLWFGGFQALMPTLGYILGSTVSSYISRYSGIVAFVLLFIIGANMIKESRSSKCESISADLGPKVMTAAALATSIDALSVGVTFSVYDINIVTSALLIGLTTFTISVLGVKIGAVFGDRYKQRAELSGGVILILIGLKLLLRI